MATIKHIITKVSPFRSKDKKHDLPPVGPSESEETRRELEQKEHKEREEEESRNEVEARKREAYERDVLRDNYGAMSEPQPRHDRYTIDAIPKLQQGEHVQLRARIHHSRPIGANIVFIVFRQRMHTIQGVLTEEEGVVSENMVYWAKRLHNETIVLVEGIVQVPKDGQEEVKSTTIHKYEIKIQKLFVVAEPTVVLPFQVDDAARPEEAYEKDDARFTHINARTRLSNRILDLRTPTSQAIFQIRAGICRLFRSYLDAQQFTEIQSSKFQESATESGAAVFKVDYFRRSVFLAQSPQLAKQMCIAADMERVYEIGPVFRAENSNTHRHMTEFIGLDLEMELEWHYSEVIDLLDGMLLNIFRGLQTEFREEIEVVKQQFPHEDLVFPEKTLRLKFHEGVKLLRDSGWKEDDGSVPGDYDDLSTKGEQRLGQIIKEKYNTDYYILDKFPLDVRPFYTMPDPEDKKLSNSCDFFLRGEEILSGGQRIHDALLLEARMKEANIDPTAMKDYLDGFRWGCPPHGGGGIGLERVVMLFLNIRNIRWASLFPRDPRSFAKSERDATETAATIAQSVLISGPRALTHQKNKGELPPLADLIAKYGDATNTSWVDPAWTIWRHSSTGAAVGYIPSNGFAVAFGNPLCDPERRPKVIRAYLEYVQEQGLKPVWCCVDHETEGFLAQNLGWSGVIAVAEERLDPTEVDVEGDKTARRKIHRAEREGVKLHEVTGSMEEGLRQEVEQRLKEWQDGRKGKQVHLTGLRPSDDEEHRRYFYATDKEGKMCCLLVLAQLAPTHGFQIKWALEFPQAPKGAIEYILAHVIRKLGEAGVKSATFGAGATGDLQPVDNVGGLRVRMLEKSYNGLSHTFSLTNKGDFRSKFGVAQDPLYICYPKNGLGLKGINSIMKVLEDPK